MVRNSQINGLDLLQAGLAVALKPLLTMREVRDYLHISASTLQRWIARGILPAPNLKLGRILRWERKTVSDWMLSQSMNSQAKPRRRRPGTKKGKRHGN